MCTKAFLPPGAATVISIPTYAMYRVHAEQRGGRVIPVGRRPKAEGWAMDVDAVRAAVRDAGDATLVWACDPNNPTGRLEPEGTILSLLEGLEVDAEADDRTVPAVVVDEAYAEFTGRSVIGLRERFPERRRRPDGLEGLRAGRAAGRVRRRQPRDHPPRGPLPAARLGGHGLVDGRRGGHARAVGDARERGPRRA